MTENAIKPSHYHTGNIDVIKFSEENFAAEELKGFYRMNILKYVTRFDKKNGLEDLQKANSYLQELMELEERFNFKEKRKDGANNAETSVQSQKKKMVSCTDQETKARTT